MSHKLIAISFEQAIEFVEALGCTETLNLGPAHAHRGIHPDLGHILLMVSTVGDSFYCQI